ncbi:MAG: hypothetical protein ACR2G7_11565 [Acidimicrobiales bacterium]
MGRASSNKKVARAARAAGRTKSSRNLVWPLALVAVVALGSALIFISLPQKAEASPPILGDHWHAAYAVYVCGEFQPPLGDIKTDTSGIHSHKDGLIHIHPFTARYTGDGANLGTFGDTVGMKLDDDALTVPGRPTFKNGDDCGGKPGKVQVKVWDITDQEGRLLKDDLAAYAPKEGDLVTIGFIPAGTDLPQPPSAGTVPADVQGATPPGQAPATTTAPAEGSTTVPTPAPGGADGSTTSVPADAGGPSNSSTAPPTTAGGTNTSTTSPPP